MNPQRIDERLLRSDLPARFVRGVVTVAEGDGLTLGPDDWAIGALVVVARGVLLVENHTGDAAMFAPGAVLSLNASGVRCLRSAGSASVTLLTIRLADLQSRGSDSLRTDEFSPLHPSHVAKASRPALANRREP